MVKTSTRKQQRGGVPKHAIRIGKNESDKLNQSSSSVYSKALEKVGTLSRAHWNFLLRTCTKWNLIAVEIEPEVGKARPCAFWKRCIHYLLVAMYGAIMIYKFYVTIRQLADEGFGFWTFMCACTCVPIFIAACVTVGTTWLPMRFSDVFNSWPCIETIVETLKGGKVTVFDDRAIGTKVLFLVVIIHMGAINSSMLSLLGELPTCVLSTFQRTRWLELPDVVPRIVWAVVFLPLELLTVWPPMLATGVVCITVVLGLGMFKVFAGQVRKEKVENMNDWMRVYRLRQAMTVYNVTIMDWGQNVALLLLVSTSCGLIFLLYGTVRPSNIPFLVYIWFPVVGFLIMVTITSIAYDCVIIKRTVAEVSGNLESGLDSWRFRNMEARRNTVYNRMLRSLRPVSIRVGAFTEMTLAVPINVWDEVLNQLLFLLSL